MKTMEPRRLRIEHIFSNSSRDFEHIKNLLENSLQNSMDDEFEAFKGLNYLSIQPEEGGSETYHIEDASD